MFILYVHIQETNPRQFQEFLFPKHRYCDSKVCELINLLGLDVREKMTSLELRDTYLSMGFLMDKLTGGAMYIDDSEVCTYYMAILYVHPICTSIPHVGYAKFPLP